MGPRGFTHVALPLLTAISVVHQGQMAVCSHWWGCGQGCCTAGSCGHHGCLAPSSRSWGAPVGPIGCTYMTLPWLGATGGAYQAQMAVCGHQGAGGHRGTAGSPGHHGWFAPSSRCWGAPVRPIGCNYVVPPQVSATSGVHQAQMAVCGHQGAGVCRCTTGYCVHHGWWSQSSRCLGNPMGPRGCDHVVFTLLSATSGAHQTQVAVWGPLRGQPYPQRRGLTPKTINFAERSQKTFSTNESMPSF